MKELRIIKEAEEEFWNAVFYYESKQKGLGLDLQNELRRALLLIQSQPNLWAIKFDNFRRYILHRFPFDIWYTEEDYCIRIYAIAHQKKKPGYWRNR